MYKKWNCQTKIASRFSCSYKLDIASFLKEKPWLCKPPDTNYKLTRSTIIFIVLAIIFIISHSDFSQVIITTQAGENSNRKQEWRCGVREGGWRHITGSRFRY